MSSFCRQNAVAELRARSPHGRGTARTVAARSRNCAHGPTRCTAGLPVYRIFFSRTYGFFFAGLQKTGRHEISQAHAKKKQYVLPEPGCREKKTVRPPRAGMTRKKKQYVLPEPGCREKKTVHAPRLTRGKKSRKRVHGPPGQGPKMEGYCVPQMRHGKKYRNRGDMHTAGVRK